MKNHSFLEFLEFNPTLCSCHQDWLINRRREEAGDTKTIEIISGLAGALGTRQFLATNIHESVIGLSNTNATFLRIADRIDLLIVKQTSF